MQNNIDYIKASRLISPDLMEDIADCVRMFQVNGGEPGGNCVPRALIGQIVLRECGLNSRLVAGGMLYRVGKHRRRDTLRFCLPNNKGGYLGAHLIGHVWNEYADQLVDFSACDWKAEAEEIYATTSDPEDRALGPVEWVVSAPEFIWQSADTLKAAWRPCGEPTAGNLWYGGWIGRCPDYTALADILANAMPHILMNIDLLRLRERVADASMEQSLTRLTPCPQSVDRVRQLALS